jgi:hypothetical protein
VKVQVLAEETALIGNPRKPVYDAKEIVGTTIPPLKGYAIGLTFRLFRTAAGA